MTETIQKLLRQPSIAEDSLCQRLVPVVTRPTGTTSTGYPYLERRAFEQFRDTVPHLFAMGQGVLMAQQKLVDALPEVGLSRSERDNIEQACRVVRQIARTAAITAPTDLWLLRHILGVHAELGLSGRLLKGEAIHPEFCEVDVDGATMLLDAEQLAIDLYFLLARGIVEQYSESFRVAGHDRVRELLSSIGPVASGEPVPATPPWGRLFAGERLDEHEISALCRLGEQVPRPRVEVDQSHWIPTVGEVQTGYLLVPMVLGLRAADLTGKWMAGDRIAPSDLAAEHHDLAEIALSILYAAGWASPGEDCHTLTELGERGLTRGPGPFGIIQTYHPYMSRAREILMQGRGKVWVQRGENVGASQDANSTTFRQANDALDRFCADTSFEYSVFIEHAIGRGEATRIRFERSGQEEIRYFGADLEDPAIDAAVSEQQAGRLPANMVFVRQADIGKPHKLIEALKGEGVSPGGAVMLVGNGFHEVRDQTDDKMVEVFRGYHQAGIVLLFTEENALSVDDLRATAWNTYHAGFKYVHEKSGQCLRPASPGPTPRLGPPLRAAWSECATRAGYVRASAYGTRTRTIYPYPRDDGHNPSISVNHFFVPSPIAEKLGLVG